MNIIDLHTDTLTSIPLEESLLDYPDTQLNIEKMRASNYSLWAAACFLMMPEGNLKARALRYFQKLDATLAKIPDIARPFTDYDEYLNNRDHGIITVLKTIEEGEILESKKENLRRFRERGVRMMTLTWNYPNSLAWPNYPGKQNKTEDTFGLTALGAEIVSELSNIGMLLDVSHLGDKSFWDAIKIYHGPIIASHSNARSVNDSVRNLTDDQIRAIAASGGVIGLNLCSDFAMAPNSTYIDSLCLHLEHIKKVGGVECLALGTDFDGIPVTEISDCSKLSLLFARLRERGFSEDELESFAHKNFERVLHALN